MAGGIRRVVLYEAGDWRSEWDVLAAYVLPAPGVTVTVQSKMKTGKRKRKKRKNRGGEEVTM